MGKIGPAAGWELKEYGEILVWGAAFCGTAEAVPSQGEWRDPSKLPPEAGKRDDEGEKGGMIEAARE
jgi:hypothetical protein